MAETKKQENKRLRDLNEYLRGQNHQLRQEMQTMREGVDQLIRATDALLIRIVQECGETGEDGCVLSVRRPREDGEHRLIAEEKGSKLVLRVVKADDAPKRSEPKEAQN